MFNIDNLDGGMEVVVLFKVIQGGYIAGDLQPAARNRDMFVVSLVCFAAESLRHEVEWTG
ncbi:hypothetical protein E4U61_004252 [Claviceps capensis]|nr:hypothetical protein E4U61_004252 [Claviceps capensis]